MRQRFLSNRWRSGVSNDVAVVVADVVIVDVVMVDNGVLLLLIVDVGTDVVDDDDVGDDSDHSDDSEENDDGFASMVVDVALQSSVSSMSTVVSNVSMDASLFAIGVCAT